MLRPFTLNDGTFLYSEDSLMDYLSSLGFDVVELQDFFTTYTSNAKDYDSLVKINEYQERVMDDYFCRLRDMGSEIEELCDKLREGKGGTKRQMADKIMSVIDYYGA